MKYDKGTFVVVPNLQWLENKPPELQVLFFWICSFANENGQCFPSRRSLAKKSGMSIRTIDKYLLELVELGLIDKTVRNKKGTKENTSNLYQIMLPDALPSATDNTTPSASLIPITIPSINYTHLTNISTNVDVPTKKKSKAQLRLETPFSLEVELRRLYDDKWVGNNIIHNYFRAKKFSFTNYGQFDTEYNQSKPHANKLLGYSSKQINEAMQYCNTNMKDIPWNLSTVVKIISNVVNIKK
jgi:hypothetical protein